uniref:Uncharacterized protein n=1 Tax=Avena sativa TaxID=4498 RepID=A0ACD5WGT0_AVESA
MAMIHPPSQRVHHSPPALIDDAMSEIFLRIPADDPKSLVLAAAVCTAWRRILCDLIFTRQYRKFHGAPPMLGFLRNTYHDKQYEEYVVSNFVSTASFRSPACHESRHWHVLDSRHGLVLFQTRKTKRGEDLVVCDLVTYDRWRINLSPELSDIIWDDENVENEMVTWNAAVLCAKDQCDHTYCHYGPFLVALVSSDEEQDITFASVYSSVTRKWSDMISIPEQDLMQMAGRIAVMGDKVYFQCEGVETTVEYNIGEQELSRFDLPGEDEEFDESEVDLVGVDDDGMLLFTTVLGPRLYLWSLEACPNVAEHWSRRRVIELGPLLPPRALFGISVVGFAEGVGAVFLNTDAGLYTIDELNSGSGRSKKVHGEKSVRRVMPYMSFYTKAWGRSRTSH